MPQEEWYTFLHRPSTAFTFFGSVTFGGGGGGSKRRIKNCHKLAATFCIHVGCDTLSRRGQCRDKGGGGCGRRPPAVPAQGSLRPAVQSPRRSQASGTGRRACPCRARSGTAGRRDCAGATPPGCLAGRSCLLRLGIGSVLNRIFCLYQGSLKRNSRLLESHNAFFV